MNKIVLLFAFLFLWSCGDSISVPEESPVDGTVWTGSIAGEAVLVTLATQTATLRADGGVQLDMTGSAPSGDTTFLILLSGVVPITFIAENEGEDPVATINISNGGVNVNWTQDGILFRGTIGTITFTEYDAAAGGTVSGSFDIGLVTVGEVSSKSATIVGEFLATIPADSEN